MNKQEAIETIKNIDTLNINDMIAGQKVDMVIKNLVLDLISQIDEPQKVVVPKFVAKWIDTLDEHGLFGLNYDNVSKPVWDWVYENYNCNVKKLHLAYLYGYEVEKERLYTVEIPNPNAVGYSIVLGRREGKTQIKQCLSTTWQMNCSNQLTESEIKQDFEWAWDAGFAKEVE